MLLVLSYDRLQLAGLLGHGIHGSSGTMGSCGVLVVVSALDMLLGYWHWLACGGLALCV